MNDNLIGRSMAIRALKERAKKVVGMSAQGALEYAIQTLETLPPADAELTRYGRWHGLKTWISTHFVRHNKGIDHWVSTQRSDRTGVPRDKKPQDALVNHECEANAQAMINISRKRLCNQAAIETRAAWREVI